MTPYQIYECQDPDCYLRFPAPHQETGKMVCPMCGAAALFVQDPQTHTIPPASSPTHKLTLFLDNLRSTYNVGSIFRTADHLAINHIHLAGITPAPHNPKVAKTALGAEQTVPWSYHRHNIMAAQSLREQGFQLWALEGGARSKSLFSIPQLPPAPVVLIFGHELLGVDPSLLALCDQVLAIPRHGAKHSLNVTVAVGIAVTWFIHNQT